jgi:toxin YoeB
MSRRIVFVAAGRDMYLVWQGQSKKTLKRINLRIEAARREPFDGFGKAEPLMADKKSHSLIRSPSGRL